MVADLGEGPPGHGPPLTAWKNVCCIYGSHYAAMYCSETSSQNWNIKSQIYNQITGTVLLSLYSVSAVTYLSRGVDPYGTGGACPPNICEWGDIHGNAPHPNILEVVSFRLGLFYLLTAKTVVCCILMQILCVVSQKKLQLLGTCPPDPQSSFMSPNNLLRSTPLYLSHMYDTLMY